MAEKSEITQAQEQLANACEAVDKAATAMRDACKRVVALRESLGKTETEYEESKVKLGDARQQVQQAIDTLAGM